MVGKEYVGFGKLIGVECIKGLALICVVNMKLYSEVISYSAFQV